MRNTRTLYLINGLKICVFLGLIVILFHIIWNNYTVNSIMCWGGSCEWIIYVWLIIINICIGTKLLCANGMWCEILWVREDVTKVIGWSLVKIIMLFLIHDLVIILIYTRIILDIVCIEAVLVYDGVHPKKPFFSTRHLIWVDYKVLSQISQPIFLSLSYLNSARHFSVIELCREPFIFILVLQF